MSHEYLDQTLDRTPAPTVEQEIVRRLRSSHRTDVNRAAGMVLFGALLGHIGITFGVLLISGHLTDYEPYSFFGLLIGLLVAVVRLQRGVSISEVIGWLVVLGVAFEARITWLGMAFAAEPKVYVGISTVLCGFCVTLVDAPGRWPVITIIAVYLIPCFASTFSPLLDPGTAVYLLVAMAFNLAIVYTLRRRRGTIAELTQALSRSAHVDPLTGSASRGFLLEQGRRLVARCRFKRRPVAALFIDLDHFKRVNDKHGHDVGDEVLVTVGRVLRGAIRPTDLVGRLGGEEFVAILTETDRAGAELIAERIRQRIRSHTTPTITASIGVAWAASGVTLDDLIERADAALYEAKEGGRDRAVFAPVPPQQSF